MQTYIDELDLGEWPHIFPDNISSGGMSRPRPGWEDAVYMTPAQMCARWQDYTALPWVNNYSGNLQNCARWNASANKYEWKVNPDNDEDTDFTKGFSFQPNLLWLTKKICDALGYGYDFAKWENSDYKYLLVCNTLPYSWSNRRWAAALPHWTVNEFFMELEKFMLMEFDIDHARNKVTCSVTAENVSGAGLVNIDKVIGRVNVYHIEPNPTLCGWPHRPCARQSLCRCQSRCCHHARVHGRCCHGECQGWQRWSPMSDAPNRLIFR